MWRCTSVILCFLMINQAICANAGQILENQIVDENFGIQDTTETISDSLESDETENRIAILEKNMDDLLAENKYLRTKNLKTCEDLKNIRYNKTGLYWLDPDGSGSPVQIYCDMEKGFTEIGHDHEGPQKVIWCKGDGCFSLKLEYSVPDTQVAALIAMSEYCEQDMLFQCKMAPLKNTVFGKFFYGWWVDPNGEKKFYFDGDNSDDHVCGCDKDNSCTQSAFNSTCHCDSSLMPLWNSDSGKLTNKEDLPVKGFNYGSFFSEHQAAKITIGKLKCSGVAKQSDERLSSCASLKRSGLDVNGYYLTKDNPNSDLRVNYCDLSASGYNEEDLRVGDPQTLLKGAMMFTLSNFVCSSCPSHCDRYNSHCATYYDLSSLNATFDDSLAQEFDIDLEEGSLKVKKAGFFAFYFSNPLIKFYIGNLRCSNSCFHWVDIGTKLKFKLNTMMKVVVKVDLVIKQI